jgi:opacity protein-like surface antigen
MRLAAMSLAALGPSCVLLVMIATPTARAAEFALPAEFVLPNGRGAWYFGGEGGWTSLQSKQNSVPGIAFPQTWQDEFNLGVRAGYESGPWRIEEEFRWQENRTDRLVKHPSEGHRSAYAIMTNIIYDLDLGLPVSPHIGGGIGAVHLSEHVSVPSEGVGQVFPGTAWVFGYQAIAGFRYSITPAFAFDVDYRYLATSPGHFRTPPGLIVDGQPKGNLTVTSGYQSHSIVASLTYRFAAPPPPPAALSGPASR